MSTISCAYLRVYEPLSVFAPEDRDGLLARVEVSRSPTDRFALGLLDPSESLEVYRRQLDGEPFLCPAQTRLRTCLALLALERSLPRTTVDVLFTDAQIAEARREVAMFQGRYAGDPIVRPHVVQSAWHVPVRWFACFDDSERLFEHREDHPNIRYESRVGVAHERMTEALEAVRSGAVHPVIVGMVHDLHEWLGTFDERSLVELDYASVARLFDPDDLADDRSAADIRTAIEALGLGDGSAAARAYARVNERWAPLRARESLN